jgi:DNA-binding transcriptional MerR regulator
MSLMQVNQAARTLGCTESWLRRAEGRGLIPAARRDLRGWRVYTDADIEILRRLLSPVSIDTQPAAHYVADSDPGR